MGRDPKPARFKEAKPSVSRKASNNDGAEVGDLEKRLAEALQRETEGLKREAEALEQQSATAEILRIISSSPSDAQPVFDAIAVNALRLCVAEDAVVVRYDSELLHVVAYHNVNPQAVERLKRQYPMAPDRHHMMGRAVLDGSVVQVVDLQTTQEFSWSIAREFGARGHVSIPLLLQGRAIGAIGISREALGPFSDRQVALLQTFADQAVIAIENVRLFTELRARNRDLSEALDQQTATSNILRVISSSPTSLQPVLDVVAENAARVCGATDAVIRLLEGDVLRRVAKYGPLSGRETMPLDRGSAIGRAVFDRRTIHIEDMAAELEAEFPISKSLQHGFGYRTVLATPLLREGAAIGGIVIRRPDVQPFTGKQIELLKTFADQAVIAIENVRLFTELQQKNEALTQAHGQVTEALERQTAMSEILRTISSSPTDLAPTFDTILRSATRLTGAAQCALMGFDGEMLTLLASNAPREAHEAMQRSYPYRATRRGLGGRVVLDRDVVHIPDVSQDPDYGFHDTATAANYRAMLGAPLFRKTEVIGALGAMRAQPGPFTDAQIELFRTFAAQAVIAIENVRLFKELQARTAELTRSVDELTALGEVSRALSSTLDFETVLQTIVLRANELAGTAGCTIWEYDQAREEFRLRASDYPDVADAAVLQGVDQLTTISKGLGVTAQVFEQRLPVQVHDIAMEGAAEETPIRRQLITAGHRALLGVPLLSEDEVIGVLAVTRKTLGEFAPEIVRLLSTFATQSALAIQNARLFREIEQKSRELEAASRHKSEFLANMSHELRTPLNAIIGFSEVLAERMFGDLNERQQEYLKDIHASGQHLLSLINDILDLSKIEAGRMELEPTELDLPTAIDNALTLVRERATRRGIALHHEIDARLGRIQGDERKLKQVLLNLLSNAIKFTPEGGRIDVRAALVDGMAEVAVADTGVGIASEDQEAVFEEFRQVGTADKKVEGTGLGLTLCRKFVELHGGRIWVTSQMGAGSTFTFTIPIGR